MASNANTDNNIFKYVFIGAILFCGTVGFTLLNFSNIAALQLSYLLAAGALGLASVSLLYKAIKHDQERVKWDV